MNQFFLDVVETSFWKEKNHLLLIIVAIVSLAALVGLFIYRKRKSS